MNNRLADLPTVTLSAVEPEPEPEPPPSPPAPEPARPCAEERKRRALVDSKILAGLAATGRPMAPGELLWLHVPHLRRVGPVKEACERMLAEGRLTYADSPSNFTSSGTVRHYALAPRPSSFDALLDKVRDRRVGPARPDRRAKGGRS